MCSLLKKPTLNPMVYNNYCLVANTPFWGKGIERVVVVQLQEFMENADYLDPYQSGLRRSLGLS